MKAFLLKALHVILDGVVARTLAIGLPPSAASSPVTSGVPNSARPIPITVCLISSSSRDLCEG